MGSRVGGDWERDGLWVSPGIACLGEYYCYHRRLRLPAICGSLDERIAFFVLFSLSACYLRMFASSDGCT